MKIGNCYFDTENETYIMGILNVTPDSFSDGGKYNGMDRALFRVEEMIQEGAHIIDIGGESTRPGFVTVSVDEEIQRVIPILESIKERFEIPVSVDTYKSQVAKQAIISGCDMINDIWGLRYDDAMAGVIASGNVCCCLMQNRKEAVYSELVYDVANDLKQSVKLAKEAGIEEDKIILDPGVGFAKSYQDNLEIIKNFGVFRQLGYPTMLATSRKSFIGLATDMPKENRVEGTLVTTVFGIIGGASFVRVHDIKENQRAIRMAQAILKG